MACSRNWPKRFLNDNTIDCTSSHHQKLLDLGWEALPHPPCNPDPASSDYYLFATLNRHMAGIQYDNMDDLIRDLSNFFDAQLIEFFRRNILSLHKCWKQAVEIDGVFVSTD